VWRLSLTKNFEEKRTNLLAPPNFFLLSTLFESTRICCELLSLKVKLAPLSKHKIRLEIAVNISTISKDTDTK
jgi:hypothetical protein